MEYLMKLSRYLLIGLLMVCLNGCLGERSKGDVIRVSVLRGPSAVAFAGWMAHTPQIDGKPLVMEVYDSPEQIQAAMIKEEADITVLPMVNAANLYSKDIPYQLAGCPVWGTLYIIGKDSINTLHLFGAGTSPDILARHYLTKANWHCALDYSLTTPVEITQGLLIGKVEAAVLSEPFVGMVLQRDSSMHVLADLNHLDSETGQGFAQTAVMFHHSLLSHRKQIDSLLTVSCRFVSEQPEEAIRTLESRKLFAEGMLTPAGVGRLRIHYVPADMAKDEIHSFLQLIYDNEPKAVGGDMPDKGFINREP